MEFDAVIVTRNRAEALALSLPLLVAQSRPPARIIVIDSSDDPAPARAAAEAVTGRGIPVHFEHGPKGLTRQRNRGLALVTAPVVFFPDDDSLCHPGTTEAIMRIYERDTEGAIAGVCAADAKEPPPGVDLGQAYAMRADHAHAARRMSLRNRMEKRLTDLNPFLALGRMLQRPAPAWLAEENAVPVEWMTGFRMSFRTEVIRRTGFEEAFRGYGLYEDIDASFAATRAGVLVGANSARIHHHRFPSGRPDRRAFAVMTVLNRAFVIARHSAALPEDQRRAVRAKTRNYALVRLAMLLPKLRQPAARDDFRGTNAALAAMAPLFTARPEALVPAYDAARTRLGVGG